MAFYFLVVARQRPVRSRYEADTAPPLWRDTRPARPWTDQPAARPWVDSPAPRSLPAYDMEHFPTDEWGAGGSPVEPVDQAVPSGPETLPPRPFVPPLARRRVDLPAPAPTPARANLPVYDMEDFPADNWGASV